MRLKKKKKKEVGMSKTDSKTVSGYVLQLGLGGGLAPDRQETVRDTNIVSFASLRGVIPRVLLYF